MCNKCGRTEKQEQEVSCWTCGGEMIYQERWVEATPLECPTRWEVIKEDMSMWWKKNRGEPEDPNGFGHNLFQLIFWIGIFGVVVFLLIVSGK